MAVSEPEKKADKQMRTASAINNALKGKSSNRVGTSSMNERVFLVANAIKSSGSAKTEADRY